MRTKTYSHLILAFWGILSVVPGKIGAQSASFSQYYMTRMQLNPALTGEQPGPAVTLAYREQWTNVPGGLRTMFASFEQRCNGVPDAIGLSVLSNTEGEGFLNTTEVNAQYARLIPIKNKRGRLRVDLRLGARVGWGNKRIDWPRLVFSDQLHPVLGQILPQSPGAVPILQSKSYFSNGLGATLSFDITNKKKKNYVVRLGFAATNLFRPNESLQQLGTLLPTKYTGHADVEIPIFRKGAGRNEKQFSLVPSARFDFQGGINSLMYGLFASYDKMFMGAYYQNTYLTFDPNNTNAVIFMGGIRFEKDGHEWKIGYSYDTNPTGLGLRSFGVHELTLRYTFKGGCWLKGIFKPMFKEPTKAHPCPVF